MTASKGIRFPSKIPFIQQAPKPQMDKIISYIYSWNPGSGAPIYK